jgi:CheY-like chemotaxis protein
MPLVLICAPGREAEGLTRTLLWRNGVERNVAKRREDAVSLAGAARLDLIVVDHGMPDAERLIRELRNAPGSRSVSIAVVGAAEFDPFDVGLIQAGANAILRPPSGPDWDERLGALMQVPPRRTGRVPAELQFEVMAGGVKQRASGTVLNLSEHGMFVECDMHMPLGADIDFRIHLGDEARPLRGCGQIVRQEGELRCGIRFYALESQGLARVRTFVRS